MQSIIKIVILTNRTLNTINQLHELTVYVVEQNKDIICVQDYRHYNNELEVEYHDAGN